MRVSKANFGKFISDYEDAHGLFFCKHEDKYDKKGNVVRKFFGDKGQVIAFIFNWKRHNVFPDR